MTERHALPLEAGDEAWLPRPPSHRKKGCTDRWENEGGPARQDEAPSADGKLPDMKKLGITPVQLTVYDCAGYRYSSLRDAIAASHRAIKAAAS